MSSISRPARWTSAQRTAKFRPYYKGGEYDFLLNSDKQLDLLNKRFIVFELDNIKDNKVLFPIVTLSLIHISAIKPTEVVESYAEKEQTAIKNLVDTISKDADIDSKCSFYRKRFLKCKRIPNRSRVYIDKEDLDLISPPEGGRPVAT